MLVQGAVPAAGWGIVAQRPIVEPLGLYDVPGRSDGAACLVLASEEVAKATQAHGIWFVGGDQAREAVAGADDAHRRRRGLHGGGLGKADWAARALPGDAGAGGDEI